MRSEAAAGRTLHKNESLACMARGFCGRAVCEEGCSLEADLHVCPKEFCQVVMAKPGSPVLRRAAITRLQGWIGAGCQQSRGVL